MAPAFLLTISTFLPTVSTFLPIVSAKPVTAAVCRSAPVRPEPMIRKTARILRKNVKIIAASGAIIADNFVYLSPTNKTVIFMEKKIIHIETIAEYNALLGLETRHPLVSVIDLSKACRQRHSRHTFGFYVIFLKEVKCGDIIYGCQKYDYQEGTVVCLAPGQVIGFEDDGSVFQPKGWALCFHPDLLYGTALGSHMKEYTFFSYEINEALHLSQGERDIFTDCLDKIRREADGAPDRLSHRLIATYIEILLDYCLRFYERQFFTREPVNADVLTRFETLLDNYFSSERPRQEGLPTVKWCASEFFLSSNYFGDLIKRKTGKTPQEHIQLKLIDRAKRMVLDTGRSISQVSYEMGFQYPQHFTRLFKKVVGMTPNEYRHRMIV